MNFLTRIINSFKIAFWAIENDYVPNSLLPGKYGDYLALDINEDGVITNWKPNISFKEFFPEDND